MGLASGIRLLPRQGTQEMTEKSMMEWFVMCLGSGARFQGGYMPLEGSLKEGVQLLMFRQRW